MASSDQSVRGIGKAAGPKGFVQSLRRIDSDITSMEMIRTEEHTFQPKLIGSRNGYKICIYTKYDRFLIYAHQKVEYKGVEWEVEELFGTWVMETMRLKKAYDSAPDAEKVSPFRDYKINQKETA